MASLSLELQLKWLEWSVRQAEDPTVPTSRYTCGAERRHGTFPSSQTNNSWVNCLSRVLLIRMAVSDSVNAQTNGGTTGPRKGQFVPRQLGRNLIIGD